MPSLLAVGLLTRLIRAKDGDDVTVETLARDYSEGESALTKAMRALVDRAYVVKFKVQRSATETLITDDGVEVIKRGGSWFTTFSVDSIPFTKDDIAEMLAEIVAGGNVKAVRVEPAHLDPRADGAALPSPRPTPQNAGVGPTWGNAPAGDHAEDESPGNSGPRPTPQQPGVGRPAPGRTLANKETVLQDSLSTAGSPSDQDERESTPTADDTPAPAAAVPDQRTAEDLESEAGPVVQAYISASSRHGYVISRSTRDSIRQQAAVLMAELDCTPEWLAARAAEMAPMRWTDLGKHVARSKVPMVKPTAGPAAAPPECDLCHGTGRREDPVTFLDAGKCECRTTPATD